MHYYDQESPLLNISVAVQSLQLSMHNILCAVTLNHALGK